MGGGSGLGIAFIELGHRHFLTMEVIQLKLFQAMLLFCHQGGRIVISRFWRVWGREGDVACYTTSRAGLIHSHDVYISEYMN